MTCRERKGKMRPFHLQVAFMLVLLLGCHLLPSKTFTSQILARYLTPIEVYRYFHVLQSSSSATPSAASCDDGDGINGRGKMTEEEDSSLEASRASLAAIVDRSWKKVSSLIPHSCLLQSTDEVM